VLLYNRTTGKLKQLASSSASNGYVYTGQVNGTWATWGRVTPHGQDVYLYRIGAKTSTLIARPAGVFAQYDPAVTANGTVYFEQTTAACRPKVGRASPTQGRARAADEGPRGTRPDESAERNGRGIRVRLRTRREHPRLGGALRYQGCETRQTGLTVPGSIYDLIDGR
jgi:hypothetical protein